MPRGDFVEKFLTSSCKDILQMDIYLFIAKKLISVISSPYLVRYNLNLAKVRSRHRRFDNGKGRGKSLSRCFELEQL